jgi:hypothetical protein
MGKFGGQAVQQEERAAGHFQSPADEKPLQQFIAPSEREFFMTDVVRPLPGFLEKLPGVGSGTIQQLGKRVVGEPVKLLGGGCQGAQPACHIGLAFHFHAPFSNGH